MDRLIRIGYFYSALSLLLGPLIFYIGYWVISAAGSLCFDSAPLWEESPESIALASNLNVVVLSNGQLGIEFTTSQIFMIATSAVLLITGIMLALRLSYYATKERSIRLFIPLLLVLIMIGGYGLIIQFGLVGCPI